MSSKVLETTKIVCGHSKSVSIDEDAVKKYCNAKNNIQFKHWYSIAPVDVESLSLTEALNYAVLLNSLSYCYWENPKWEINYNEKKYDGAIAMMVCVFRIVNRYKGIKCFSDLNKYTIDEFAHDLKGNREISLFNKRYNNMKQIVGTITDKYDDNILKLLDKGDYDALKICEIIANEFSGFNDKSEYNNEQVYYYKKAQLMVGDINHILVSKKTNTITNIDKLSACADYKLPMVLQRYGILKYERELNGKIISKVRIEKDSTYENEIRSNTIWAVEMIKRQMAINGNILTSLQINDELWLDGQTKELNDSNYHLTETEYY